MGLEPTTSGFTVRRSDQLSYVRHSGIGFVTHSLMTDAREREQNVCQNTANRKNFPALRIGDSLWMEKVARGLYRFRKRNQKKIKELFSFRSITHKLFTLSFLMHIQDILFYLYFQCIERIKFPIFAYFVENFYRKFTTIDIVMKVEKVCLEGRCLGKIYTDSTERAIIKTPDNSIDSGRYSTLRFEVHICCRISECTTEVFAVNDGSSKVVHYSFWISVRRFSPAIANPWPIRSRTCSSVLQVRIPKMIAASYVRVRSIIPRAVSEET